MVPSSEPEEVSVLWIPMRSTRKVPVALAKRPVPSVMVAFSTIVTMPLATIPTPVNVPEMLSPFAAVSVKDPIVVDGAIPPIVMSNSNLAVKRPKWVACPVPVRTECRTGNAPVWTSLASKVPRNGNSEPRVASVSPTSPGGLDGAVGALGLPPAHAVANRHKPSTAYRICDPPGECLSWTLSRMARFAVRGC